LSSFFSWTVSLPAQEIELKWGIFSPFLFLSSPSLPPKPPCPGFSSSCLFFLFAVVSSMYVPPVVSFIETLQFGPKASLPPPPLTPFWELRDLRSSSFLSPFLLTATSLQSRAPGCSLDGRLFLFLAPGNLFFPTSPTPLRCFLYSSFSCFFLGA